jgi:DNA-binding NarL/FixJ family response regulator
VLGDPSFVMSTPTLANAMKTDEHRDGRDQLRVLIVDDHPIMIDGLRHLIVSEFPDAEIGVASDAGEMWSHIQRSAWEIILLDIGLPGTSGIELLKSLKTELPETPVLILTGYTEDQYAVRAIRAGASGYLNKAAAVDELTRAIHTLADGDVYVSDSVKHELFRAVRSDTDDPPHHALSDREYSVFCRLAAGMTVTEVATELSLSPKTVSTYRSRLLLKLGLQTNQDLVKYSIRHHLDSGISGA